MSTPVNRLSQQIRHLASTPSNMSEFKPRQVGAANTLGELLGHSACTTLECVAQTDLSLLPDVPPKKFKRLACLA